MLIYFILTCLYVVGSPAAIGMSGNSSTIFAACDAFSQSLLTRHRSSNNRRDQVSIPPLRGSASEAISSLAEEKMMKRREKRRRHKKRRKEIERS
jgi:hypothetical protein